MPEEADPPKAFEEITGRPEEAAVFNDPIEIKIGEKTYQLRKHSMRAAREWRSKLLKLQQALQTKSGNGAGEVEVFSYINDSHLPALCDLIVSYCQSSGLTIEILENEGTDEQLIDAFSAILRHCRIPLERMKIAI